MAQSKYNEVKQNLQSFCIKILYKFMQELKQNVAKQQKKNFCLSHTISLLQSTIPFIKKLVFISSCSFFSITFHYLQFLFYTQFNHVCRVVFFVLKHQSDFLSQKFSHSFILIIQIKLFIWLTTTSMNFSSFSFFLIIILIINLIMLYTIQELIEPITNYYNNWINGQYLSGLLQFKAQREIGSSYISKVFRAQRYEINAQYEDALIATQTPTYKGFLSDNWFRIVFLNALQRLSAAAQMAPKLPERFGRPNSTSFLFTQIMNDGAFRGTLRGLSMSFIQTSLVLWPTVLLTNKTDGGLKEFVATYALLDLLLHPIDCIKTRLYGHTTTPYKLREVLSLVKFHEGFRGSISKFVFNVPFASALYLTAQDDSSSTYAWIASFLAYPLLVNKSTLQAVNLNSWGYRGAIPFFIVNYLFAWKLSAIYSEKKLKNLQHHAQKECREKLGYY